MTRQATIHCSHCGRPIFFASYHWHLYMNHGRLVPTPAGGWTQERADMEAQSKLPCRCCGRES